MIESRLLGFHPGPGVILACKEDDWGDDVGKIRDKFSVEVRESKERTDAFD